MLLIGEKVEEKRKPEKKATIVDIAREAGVSTTTVTRVLDPKQSPGVTPEIREKVLKVIRRRNYQPSVFARKMRAMRSRKRFTLGILTFPSKDLFRSGYHREILNGIHDEGLMASHALKFFILTEEHHDRLEEVLYEQGIDGLLILSWRCHPKVIELVEKAAKGLPLVIFNDYKPGLGVNILYTDVREGMRKAVHYLAGKEKTKIAFFAGPKECVIQNGGIHRISSYDAQEKLQGFLEAMKEKGFSVKEEWIFECPSYHEGESYQGLKPLIKAWNDKKELPEAIICGNDAIALDAWRALKDYDLWPGQKMPLIGFDDIEKGRAVSPSLTTVRQPLYEMGKDAVKILIDRIENPIDPGKELVQKCYVPELILRQSA